jgi:uncharacterized protein YcgL (UPF0745 family)
VSADEVRESIARQGFYLQMPPKDHQARVVSYGDRQP